MVREGRLLKVIKIKGLEEKGKKTKKQKQGSIEQEQLAA